MNYYLTINIHPFSEIVVLGCSDITLTPWCKTGLCEISGSHCGEYEVYRVFWDVAPWSRKTGLRSSSN
jgi:hypothetical protein